MFHQHNILYNSQCIREYHSLNRDASTEDFRVGGRTECVGNAVRFSRKVEVELSLGGKIVSILGQSRPAYAQRLILWKYTTFNRLRSTVYCTMK